MDPVAILRDDLEKKLDILKQQETFLNINPAEDSPLCRIFYLIFLILKCLAAGYGTSHLLNTYTKMAFVIGTFINAYTNVKSWFVPAFSIMFGVATFVVLNYGNKHTALLTILWIIFCLRLECEFYLDIYLILCLVSFIFKMYGKEYKKAAAFVMIMVCLNWIMDSEEFIKAGKVHFIPACYIWFFFGLMPSRENVQEKEIKKRYSYVCVNLMMFLFLLFKCYRVSLGKNIEDALEFIRKRF